MNEQLELKAVIAGLGGQGIVFATRLLAQTAANLGHPVMVSEVHGMSQRGGSVISHLKIGGSEAPLVRRGTADLLLALAPDEAIRNLAFLRQGGGVFANAENSLHPGDPGRQVVQYLEQLNIHAFSLPASRMAMQLGSAAVANIMLIGFAAACTATHPFLPLSIDALRETLAAITSQGREAVRFSALNLQALEWGYRAGRERKERMK